VYSPFLFFFACVSREKFSRLRERIIQDLSGKRSYRGIRIDSEYPRNYYNLNETSKRLAKRFLIAIRKVVKNRYKTNLILMYNFELICDISFNWS